MVNISKWSLELVQHADVNNCGTFTHYLGFEIRLIIHKMELMQPKPIELPKAHQENLHREYSLTNSFRKYFELEQAALIESRVEEGTSKENL